MIILAAVMALAFQDRPAPPDDLDTIVGAGELHQYFYAVSVGIVKCIRLEGAACDYGINSDTKFQFSGGDTNWATGPDRTTLNKLSQTFRDMDRYENRNVAAGAPPGRYRLPYYTGITLRQTGGATAIYLRFTYEDAKLKTLRVDGDLVTEAALD